MCVCLQLVCRQVDRQVEREREVKGKWICEYMDRQVGWWAGGLVGWWAGGLVGWWAGGLVGWWAGGLVGMQENK